MGMALQEMDQMILCELEELLEHQISQSNLELQELLKMNPQIPPPPEEL
ncbi:MAG: hypothetical protein U1F57_07180 [bacterium]